METLPKTVDEAVEVVLSWLSEEDRQYVVSNDIFMLHFSLGLRIRNELALWAGNDALLKDAARVAQGEKDEPVNWGGEQTFMPDDASMVILSAVKKRILAEPQ